MKLAATFIDKLKITSVHHLWAPSVISGVDASDQ
jgi:hypothetical protein